MADIWDDSLDELRTRLSRQGSRARALAPGSQAAYVRDAGLVAGWLRANGVPGPDRVSASAIEAAMRQMRWSPATRARALTALQEWLAPLYLPGRCPAELVDRPKVVPGPVPRLSQADAAAVVESTDPRAAMDPRSTARALALRDRALLELLYGSGLRRQEACDLVLSGLDFEHETARVVGKGARPRTVPLTEPTVDALRAWLGDGRPRLALAGAFEPAGRARVFLTRSGRPLDGSTVYRVVARALRRAGRAGGPHLMRHAAGTHLLEGPGGRGGAHLRVVQEVLGHASLATTQRYTGVSTRAVQEMLRRGHPRG